ncbi:MAG: hypothetical protein QMD77_01970 [Patescibacteria group bacterium]|nr:hypothetical protein [Patescibacteria group bacterium]
MVHKKIFRFLGLLGMGVVIAVLALSAILYIVIMLPFVDNTITDIDIKATREGLYGPYTHSNLGDRLEILYAKVFGSEAAKSMFPSRELKLLNPNLHLTVPEGLCNETGAVSGTGRSRLEIHKQQMAEYNKKIAELREKAKKLRRENEETIKKQKEIQRLAGIIFPPLGYIFWLFKYCS